MCSSDLAEMEWQKTRFPGCEAKTLLFDKKTGLMTALMKFAPGANRISAVISPVLRSNSSVLASQPGKRVFCHSMQSYNDQRGYFETTLSDSITKRKPFRSGLSIHDISRPGEMKEIAFLAADLAIDAGLEQAWCDLWAQQQMIEAQSGVARPAVALVVPEREHRF